MDGMLSQEEINALLSGMSSDSGNDAAKTRQALSDVEKDAIGEVSNISMGTAATTLSSLVNQKVIITTPVVSYASWEELSNDYDRPCVFIQIYYKDGLDGSNILVLKENDVKIITDLMMGGDGSNIDNDLTELHLSAISEAMNQMMGSAATSLSSMMGKRVDISPPKAQIVDLNGTIDDAGIVPFMKDEFVKVAFKMEIGNLVDSELMQLYPFDFARSIYEKFSGGGEANNTAAASASPPVQETKAAQQSTNASAMPGANAGYGGQEMYGQSMQGMPNMQGMQNIQGMQNVQGQGMPYMQGTAYGQGIPYGNVSGMTMSGVQGNFNGANYNYMMQNTPDVNVQQAQFQPFTPQNIMAQPENIELIMDVPLEVTVELGRTSKSIKEILEFSPGTIIELNRLAGEPIDVLVNGKFVAKGEVVVIEESFGIRVTEIIK